ncbi:hypothetical protein M3204_16200 [Mesobacillus subterraneus]|uniref:hypothetical protein n=1 Tax=Mesobacillus subterraneus TaxID=285983 RepID=UPI00203A7CD9|nr:hypothetical protein [Mesobacillus subterraneus]MCM3665959.1 hypothetical protein [Mesobacillus subterraneus]MCM3684842.1 hypothetical protein [Mesobacillus subterraneus]
MKVLKLTLSLFLLFIFQLPDAARADNTSGVLKMEELTVQVMPEYSYHPKDKKKKNPPLLVGYHGALKNNAEKAQKGQVVIPLPMDEKNFRIGYVADYSRDLTEMNEIEYELDKERGTIAWETSEEIQPQEIYKFVIEYYTDSVKEKEDTNTLTYNFKSFAEIGLLNLIFIEPLKTESFKLEPEAEQHQKNSYNMNMFLFQSQGMKSNEEKNIKLEYKRSETKTTAEIMEDMAGDSKKAGTVKQNEEKMSLWIVILVVGGISVSAAFVLLLVMKKKTAKPRNKTISKETENEAKKTRLRTMFMDGSITEAEYNELLKKLGGKK